MVSYSKRTLRETITDIGMSNKNAKIECLAKPITHAFIQFKDNDERNKYVRSAHMLRKELSGRKIKITRSMRKKERFHHKGLGFFKCCIHTRHIIPFNAISLNWISKCVSVNGQIVVRTCQCVSLKYHKYQDIKWEIVGRNDCEQSWGGTKTQGWREDYE